MLTDNERIELKVVNKSISKCLVRISNTLNTKTEEKIRKELIPLEKRKAELVAKESNDE